MKNCITSLGTICVLFVACSVNEMDISTPSTRDCEEFYASIEDTSTKVFADEKLRVLWNADDRVSIFNKYTYNQEYRFTGEDGDNSGSFKKVPNDDFVTGNSLDLVYSVYPYQESTKINNDGVITVSLPAEQSYRENSFGQGANTMISATDDNQLLYKNLCGYLVIKLYGDNVSVTSISLKGNNNESLAGKATVNASVNEAPSMSFDPSATKEITLSFDNAVALGTTVETATAFWIVVPPTVFSKGFTLAVKDNKNGIFEKSTSKSFEIRRNTLSRMSSLAIFTATLQPNNIIYYTSLDGEIVAPYNSNAFGADIVSNEYSNGKGAITFDKDVAYIDDNAFRYCSNLASITLPNSVSLIGDSAFSGCFSLSSINIPESVTTIGKSAFRYCSSLSSISIPDSVSRIDDAVFASCSGLSSIVLPKDLTSIGTSAFSECTSLNSIQIPNSVSSIGPYAFYGCSSLKSIRIPISVACIDNNTFQRCSELTYVSIPDSVISINDQAFSGCSNLSTILLSEKASLEKIEYQAFYNCNSIKTFTFPNNLKSIGSGAFEDCDSLISIKLPKNVTEIAGDSFFCCPSLESITVEDGNPVYDSRENCNAIIRTENNALISGCSNTIIPNTVTIICSGAFAYCFNLKSLIIPESVTSIGTIAFSNCTGLTAITIPSSVNSLGSSTFISCSSLSSVTIEASNPPDGKNMFEKAKSVSIYVPAESIGAYKIASGWKPYASRIHSIYGSISPEAVDLGLSVKWASFNLGATKPEMYGNYYAWAEISPKDSYSKDNYELYMSGSWDSTDIQFFKYDGSPITLTQEDDAANVRWEENWRMPTDAEWTELREQCSWTWTTDYFGTGISGYVVMSNVTGFTSNSIFLPAAGYRYENNWDNAGLMASYWSSSLCTETPQKSWGVFMTSNNVARTTFYRYYGHTIRPVLD